MDLTKVAPEFRAWVRFVPHMPIASRLGLRFTRAFVSLMPTAKVADVEVTSLDSNDPPLRLYVPTTRQVDGALLWIHGGGFVVGNAAMDDRMCGETSLALGIVVVSVDYRLAPEHPFPAASDDCLRAWQWLQRKASSLGVDPSKVAVGGQSAGAGLAASLAQRVHDGEGNKVKAQWLFCPMLDDRTAAKGELDRVKHRLWNNRSNAVAWRSFLGAQPGGPHVPRYAVPARRIEFSGLPPAWIGVGDIDLFFDEDRTYAELLRQAGVEVTFQTVEGAPHGFESWVPGSPVARSYIASARNWLQKAISDPR